MSLDPRPSHGFEIEEVREAARTQASRTPAALMVLAGIAVALFAMVVFVIMDYGLDQAPHRMVKVFAGLAVFSWIALQPAFGLLAFVVVVPFLPWVPPVPIPGVNATNMLLLTIFGAWAIARVRRGEAVFRAGTLGPAILIVLVLSGLSIIRGVAFPTGLQYEAGKATLEWVRAIVTIGVYFVGTSMIRGAAARRRIAWAMAIALLAESITTIILGRTGRGGRAVGSLGQPNELGAFLAIYAGFAAAMIVAVRAWWQRGLLLATVVTAVIGVFLSVSRGALLAVGIGLFYVAARTSKLLLAVVLLVAVSAPLWIPDYVMERLSSTLIETEEGADETALEGSAQSRVDTWTALLDIVQRHPLDGVGFSGVSYLLYETGQRLGLEEVHSSEHNTYLRFLAEMGVLGLAAFVYLLIKLMRLSLRGVRLATSRFDRQLAVGLGAGTLVLMVSCAFGDRFWVATITTGLWLLAASVNDAVLETKGTGA